MPFGDKTGPRGEGPRTGRRMGYCYGFPYPGYLNPRGRGFGRGFGRGWGRSWQYPPFFRPDAPYYPPEPPTVKEEKEMLSEELKALREEMKAIGERLKELETPKKKS